MTSTVIYRIAEMQGEMTIIHEDAAESEAIIAKAKKTIQDMIGRKPSLGYESWKIIRNN